MGSDSINFGILLISVPLISIPNNNAHVITSRDKEKGILSKAGNRVHVSVHFAPPLSRFELVNLNLIKVASNYEVAILGFILVLEVMDAQDLVTLIDSQVNMLAIID